MCFLCFELTFDRYIVFVFVHLATIFVALHRPCCTSWQSRQCKCQQIDRGADFVIGSPASDHDDPLRAGPTKGQRSPKACSSPWSQQVTWSHGQSSYLSGLSYLLAYLDLLSTGSFSDCPQAKSLTSKLLSIKWKKCRKSNTSNGFGDVFAVWFSVTLSAWGSRHTMRAAPRLRNYEQQTSKKPSAAQACPRRKHHQNMVVKAITL